MVNPWQAGDLALCINQKGWFLEHHPFYLPAFTGPKPGSIHTVTRIIPDALYFAEFMPASYLDICFIKLDPHVLDEDDHIFITIKEPEYV